ncbi:hypothetical protein N452_04095 [Clostridium botulinum A2 117]|uniref:hypothetical protein n=1 Tax=Clostridium botulinum TaxID=1491 RepID=UPI0007E0604E|nr:hypothetical protein [Clostridium botulinum]KEI77823.1 hypothetical protein N452_04095 [Clostridium botulinum A2 117]MBN3414996.1 hypothetical protein [Clostridium botulinum]MBN3441289.1 hypothetical protein [Clostridium botulinum]MBY6805356.1 hypothetical protein [Clostridium botulinum]
MATFGERFKNQLRETIMQLDGLSKKDYQIEDLVEVISSFGTKLELFFKSVIFPEINSRNNLVRFIDELLIYGFSQDKVKVLHDIRKEYNNAKHEPTYEPSLLEISNLIMKVTPIIDDLVNLDLGITSNYVHTGFKRIFWIVSWDHYIGGDTEIHIILPDETNHWLGPPSLDMIYIEMSSWDTVKVALGQVGILKYGKELIPPNLYKSYSSEGDFLDVLVFEGHYKDLISILSQYERRNELLSGLMRHNDSRAMLQACLLATLDVITSTIEDDRATIVEKVKLQAVNVYAIPKNYKGLHYMAESIMQMFFNIERHYWIHISGLKWLHEKEFKSAKNSAIAIHEEFKVLINNRYTVCIIRN